MPRVLLIGAAGMLGRDVARVLAATPGVELVPASRERRPGWVELNAEGGAAAVERVLDAVGPDVVVNCAAVLAAEISKAEAESVRRAVTVNALFPHELAIVARGHEARVVHISTDGVFRPGALRCFEDGDDYATDVYGTSKRLGEPFLDNVLSVRCSFVGRDPERRRGLLEWLLRQPNGADVHGFVDQAWNGVTTEQVALACAALVEAPVFESARAEGRVHHLFEDPPLSKYDVLVLITRAFEVDANVVPIESGRVAARVLGTRYRVLRDRLQSGPSRVASLEAIASREPS